MSCKGLHKTRRVSNDEFYTRYVDIEKELSHYDFRGKRVYCNCDDYRHSNFVTYFIANFDKLGLDKLVVTCFIKDSNGLKFEFDGVSKIITELNGNGDFKSKECLDILNKSDIVVTNPPFSLCRDFISVVFNDFGRDFIIVSDVNKFTCKRVFSLIANNKIRTGYEKINEFINPDGGITKFGNTVWLTNLSVGKQVFIPTAKNRNNYQKFGNYDAINIDKIKDIPANYNGVMGVPVTYLLNPNHDMFEILGLSGGLSWNGYNKIKTDITYKGVKYHRNGKVTVSSRINTRAALHYDDEPTGGYYIADNCDKYIKAVYARVFIKRRDLLRS